MIETYKQVQRLLTILLDEIDKKDIDKQYISNLIWQIKTIINDKIKEIQEEE